MRKVTTTICIALAALCCSFGLSFDAYASKRVALVVGNNDYTTLPALNNAAKDARDMAQTLRDLGWEVVDVYNSSQRDIGRAIDKFEGLLWSADASLFFYAGHGIQARGENWIVPVDAEAESEVDLRYEAIPAREVLSAMKRADVPVNIIILDACRDNPLKKRTRSSSRGLQAPEVPAGLRGTTIMFSAAPGEVAQDGPEGGNGVFTGNLLRELKKPGQTIEAVFKATSRGVNAATNRSQMPWFNSSLSGDFYFNAVKPGAQVTAVSPAPVLSSSDNVELAYWASVSGSDDEPLLQSYLAKYPEGQFAELAKLKLKALKNKPVMAALPSPAQSAASSASKFKINFMTEIVYQDQDGKLLRLMDLEKTNSSFIESDKGPGEASQLYLGVFRLGQSVMNNLRKEFKRCLTNTVGMMPRHFTLWKDIEERSDKDILSILDNKESVDFMFHLGKQIEDRADRYNAYYNAKIRKTGDNELEVIGDFDSEVLNNVGHANLALMHTVSVKSNVKFNPKLGIAQKISETWKACGKEKKFEYNLLLVKDIAGNQLSY